MSGIDLARVGVAIVSDVLSALAIPGTSTLSLLIDAYTERRRTQAAEILITELSNGGFHGDLDWNAHDIDPAISMMLRISKALLDGAAIENIRFLAQVIGGLKKYKALDEDSFRRWAAVVEGLSRSELLVTGFCYQCLPPPGTDSQAGGNPFWEALIARASTAGIEKSELYALCASISRTGLLIPLGSWGPSVYFPTEWLRDLGRYVDMDRMSRPDMA